MMAPAELKALLEDLYAQYNVPAFIADDPIGIPHRYQQKEDIEIAAFLTATLAWGQRPVILRNAERLLGLMGGEPYRFVREHTPADLTPFATFVHRTFNGTDAQVLIGGLQRLYHDHGGLEGAVASGVAPTDPDVRGGIVNLRRLLLDESTPQRSFKHVPNIERGASAKRLNMFLRWMVRRDSRGVDFGLWRSVHPRQLLCPLDLHTGRVARRLGLLTRAQDDLRAVLELTEALRRLDPEDPIRFDIALFALGASGQLEG